MTLPEIRWHHGDDLCDCTFQRIGWWTNPYIARTLEIRLCCMWKKLDEQWPGLMREIPAFTDYNNGNVFVTEPMLWNGEESMPVHLWHRQISVLTGWPLSVVREKFAGQKPPEGVRRAIEEGEEQGRSVGQHQDRGGARKASKAGRGHRHVKGRKVARKERQVA